MYKCEQQKDSTMDQVKRRMRFSPDENNIIELHYGNKVIRGLIRDESFNGYCVITNQPFAPCVGDLVELVISGTQCGKGEVVRIEPLDEVLVKIGVTILS